MTATTASERRGHGDKVQVKVRLPKAIKAKLDEYAATAGVSLLTEGRRVTLLK